MLGMAAEVRSMPEMANTVDINENIIISIPVLSLSPR
jgi:hypothetical protein